MTTLTPMTSTPTAPLTTRFFQRTEGTLAYHDTQGKGPVVVCIPGMGDLRGQYRYLVPELQKAGHRVVTLDLRGHGESSTGWTEHTAQSTAQDVLALLDHLGIQTATLIGNSFAARAALYASAQRPDRIKGMVMLGPIVRQLPMPWYMDLVVKVGFAGPWSTAFWMTYWNSLFTRQKPADHAAYRAGLQANIGQKERMAALKAFMQPDPTDTLPLLAASQTPTLVVMGTRDPDFKDATAEARLVAEKLRAELLLVEGAGHYPHTECPAEVAPQIVAFLKQVQ